MQTKNFNVYNQENKAVQDAYGLLTANVHFTNGDKTVKTITICSGTPSVGKTTIAINLAISMSRLGWKILLIDTDLRKPNSYKRLNQQLKYGLSDIMEGDMQFNEALCNTDIPNFYYLSSGENCINPLEVMSSAKFEELISEVKEQFDFVLFDTPALLSVIDGALVASKTDASIIIAEMGVTTLTVLNRVKDQLAKANVNILGVVLNNIKKRDYVKYVQSYNYFLDNKHFEKRKKTKKSMANA